MSEPNVLHVRATSETRFSLSRSGSAPGAPVERRGLSAAEVAAVIRALPTAYEIRFVNEGPCPVDLIALVNAALQRPRSLAGRGAPGAGGGIFATSPVHTG